MGEVLDFEKGKKKKGAGVVVEKNPLFEKIIREEIEYEDDEYDGGQDSVPDEDVEEVRQFYDMLDGYIMQAAIEAGIKEAKFMMDGLSVDRLFEVSRYFEYHGESTVPGDKTEYIAIAAFDEFADESNPYFIVIRVESDTAFRFKGDDGWVEDKDAWRIVQSLAEGKGTAHFLRRFEEESGNSLFEVNLESLLGVVAEAQPLIALWETVDDIAEFDISFNEEYMDFDEDGEDAGGISVSIVLRPDDFNRVGSIVSYESGKFHFFRFLPSFAALYLDDDEINSNRDDTYIAEAFEEVSIKKAAKAIRTMWDHYSRDVVFCLPLSPSAYTEYRSGTKKLVTTTTDKPRKLTGEERVCVQEIREVLRALAVEITP